MKGVRNFEGILGADNLIIPEFMAVIRSLGDMPSLGAANTGPGTSFPY
jgi:hypothetical protein